MTDRSDRMRQVVAGLSEGVILIEPDQTISYANGAALTMHGVAALDELGETVAEYRRNFVLEYRSHADIGPLQHPVERLLTGELFRDTVVEVHHFRAPEQRWMHRIRSLVTTDSEGQLTGLALVMQDVSDRYEAEARFEDMFRANPAPALVCRLADLRYVKVNQGFLDLTGYARDQVLGHSFCEIDLLTQAECRALAVERLHAGDTIPQMEACLNVPADSEKYVIVAGHPIRMPGGERCMLFTFADLEDRRKAEMELKLSEERFAKAFQLSPVPTALLSTDALLASNVNEAFAAMFGDPGSHRSGTVGGTVAAQDSLWVEEAEQARFKRMLKQAGQVRGFEARLRNREGEILDCLVSAEPVRINGETFVLCAMQDITARKRTETELIAAIETVMADASWFSHGVIEKLALMRNPPPPGKPAALVEKLTRRERDLLLGICKGATDSEIAAELGLSLSTVRNHLASLYRKIGVNRRSAVVVWARERGIGEFAPNGNTKPGKLG
ncbi:LuxR family transcriptional regulator [Methylobacterium sp. Leaf90]|jgi:PAS domain S-box-containing protein|uniref:helix-turn-helix transcriptional regulator n=1 Tax=Methylorubrum TaxID=2282523 RepID=UPI0006FF881B|nr:MULTISPECIES: helix-turn-helix transcriptional regulator [Methylorubrum]KQO92473.1 LuxR family transcriptional regulator [Methylobacterium sp. Leaf90]BDL41205.1 transcriptional regulator [Methylorubrum sp. GM97]GEL41330.1 transcriptional regulator [Methylorubrum extorquens]